MMLVILIISTATVYSLGFIREKQQQNEIRHTAQQMENILQAGIQFHSRYDMWPEQNGSLSVNDLVNHFGMQPQDFCTIWPGTDRNICAGRSYIQYNPIKTAAALLDSTYQIIQNSNDERLFANFKVTLVLPIRVRNVENIAKMIAYYLPSSQVSKQDKSYVINIYTSARIALPPPMYTYGYITHSGLNKVNSSADSIPVADKCYEYNLDPVYGTWMYKEGYELAAKQLVAMEKHVFPAFVSGMTDYKAWFVGSGLRFWKDDDTGSATYYTQLNSSGCSTDDYNNGKCKIIFNDGSTLPANQKISWTKDDKDCWTNTASELCGGMQSPPNYYYYVSMCVPFQMWQANYTEVDWWQGSPPSQEQGYELVGSNGQCNNSWVSQVGGGITTNNCNLSQGVNLYDSLML